MSQKYLLIFYSTCQNTTGWSHHYHTLPPFLPQLQVSTSAAALLATSSQIQSINLHHKRPKHKPLVYSGTLIRYLKKKLNDRHRVTVRQITELKTGNRGSCAQCTSLHSYHSMGHNSPFQQESLLTSSRSLKVVRCFKFSTAERWGFAVLGMFFLCGYEEGVWCFLSRGGKSTDSDCSLSRSGLPLDFLRRLESPPRLDGRRSERSYKWRNKCRMK